MVQKKTAAPRFRRTLRSVGEWVRAHRRLSLKEQRREPNQERRNHDAYCGVTGNYRMLAKLRWEAAKPYYAAMMDIGKISLYEGTIFDRRPATREVRLQSGYLLDERRRYNPGFELPPAAEVDSRGMLRVRYLDGDDDDFWGD